jgi:thiamine pyridinylase
MKATKTIHILFVFIIAVISAAMLAATSSGDAKETKARPLRVALFPVPDAEHVKKVVKKKWDDLKTGVELDLETYKDWDGYSETPPPDLDVFEFDAINLDYLVRNNWVSALNPDDVADAEDILDFAWKGCMVDGQLYGVPRLACTNVLFYRDGDKEIATAKGIADIYKLVGDSKDTDEMPEAGKGLLIDLKSGTNCACLYLDAVADNGTGYSLTPALPSADSLEKSGLDSLTLLAKMAGRKQALHKDSYTNPDRPKWFADGRGRCYAGYTERLFFMPKESHKQIRVRALPLGKDNSVNLFFVDLLSINPLTRGERRRLALKFVNLCTSAKTVKDCLMPSEDRKPSQYLLPTRQCVLENKNLLAAAPLYRDLAAVLTDKPLAFRLGADGRRWLSADKKLIQARLFFSP